jgi:hypothetical protein
MAEHIEVKNVTKSIIHNAKFVSLTCEEIISMDNASWASVHRYIVQDWCHIPLLLKVKHVFFGSKTNSLNLLIMNFLMTQGGLHEEDLASRLVSFGVDGVNTFQGFRFWKYSSNLTTICSHLSLMYIVWLKRLIWQYKLPLNLTLTFSILH